MWKILKRISASLQEKGSDAENSPLHQGIAIDLAYMVVCITQWKAKHPTYVTPAPGNKRDIGARTYGIRAPSTRANVTVSDY
jgi:hypothetical protein